jgi:acetyl esterase/lipase
MRPPSKSYAAHALSPKPPKPPARCFCEQPFSRSARRVHVLRSLFSTARVLPVSLSLLLVGCATHIGKPLPSPVNPPPAPVVARFSVTRDVVYTPAGWPQTLLADLYQPALNSPRPAVLLLHGGGWTGGDRRWHMRSIAEKLARRGYVVLNATYRTTPAYAYPAPLDDVREALIWLCAHAAEHHIDPTRIALYGYSAGGHLAALAGLKDGPPETRVRAIVAGGAPSDLTLYQGGKLVPLFMGGTQTEVPETYRDASPINHASADDPPVFMYHGRWDRLVPPAHAIALDAALTRAGVRHELYWLGARAHITAFIFDGKSEETAIDFLDRELR